MMIRARFGIGVLLVGLSSAPAMAAVDCLGPATAVRQAGNPEGALALCTAALEDPVCAGMRVHLEMLCALSRHDIARRDGGDAWCVARDAYAPLRASASESYAAAARAGFEETDLWCRNPSPVAEVEGTKTCATCAVVEPVSHWWWTGPGLGLVVAGGVLVGLAVEQHGVAQGLAERSDDAERVGGALTVGEYQRLYAADGNAHLFGGAGAALLGVGVVACVAGLVVGLSGGEGEAPVSFGVAPGGASVQWRFE